MVARDNKRYQRVFEAPGPRQPRPGLAVREGDAHTLQERLVSANAQYTPCMMVRWLNRRRFFRQSRSLSWWCLPHYLRYIRCVSCVGRKQDSHVAGR